MVPTVAEWSYTDSAGPGLYTLGNETAKAFQNEALHWLNEEKHPLGS